MASNDLREMEDYSAASGKVAQEDPQFYNFVLRLVATAKKFFDNVHVLKSYTVAEVALLNAVALEGVLIYVRDESGGKVPAFSDGVNFRRVTDRVIVS